MLPYALLFLAAGLAWALAARRSGHRPAAVALTALASTEVAQLAARSLYFGQPRPFTGAARVAFHVGQAAHVSQAATAVALCLVVLAGRRWQPAALAWAAFVVALVLGYPALRGDSLAVAYAAWQGLAAATCLWSLGFKRTGAPVEWVAMALAFETGGELIGAYLGGRPFAGWAIPRASSVLAYSAAILIQGSALWETRRRG